MVIGWFKESWNYRDEDGNLIEYVQWYYFDSNGKGHTGWIKDTKGWCYCRNGRL